MSQKVSRKSAVVNDEKEKKQADTPVKDMKKKMAANAEKEKQTTDKTEKTTDKADKTTDKAEKTTDKTEKATENPAEKTEKLAEKGEKSDKADKSAEKKTEKNTDKKVDPQQKKEGGSSKEDKNAKSEKEKPDPKPSKPKQNGRSHNGNDVTNGTPNTNGTSDVTNGISDANGTVSDSEDELLVVEDQDEVFPELAYDDSSDVDFEPADRTSRSYTRRSQVKATRTPETPRPASDKQTDKDDDSKDSKVLKLKEDAPLTDRKLRSADSPKPDGKKKEKEQENKEGQSEKEDLKSGDNEEGKRTEQKKDDSIEVEVIVEVESNDGEHSRKLDTNYSKSRVKVSPYRRSLRLQDQTNTSLQANYTGNNTTMEMDITESSLVSEQLDDSSYLRGLRNIRGRNSYKQLKEINLRSVGANRGTRPGASGSAASPASDSHSRPTGTVVGRKRKPEHEEEQDQHLDSPLVRKRMRVLDTLAAPFRRVATALPTVSRRHAEIVGINTDLPLTAPQVSTDNFDPESLKPPTEVPVAVPLPTPEERDNKRCVVM